MEITFGREVCCSLELAESREWLVTNGIGGYASGTIAGSLTRRYHGLLIASLTPPEGRTLLVTKLEETVIYDDKMFKLSTNRWASGIVDPQGYRFIERFSLKGSIPTWLFAFADALLERRIWMKHGENTTYVSYTLLRSSTPIEIILKPLVNYRDYHNVTQGGYWGMRIDPLDNGLCIRAHPTAQPFYLFCPNTEVQLTHDWYVGHFLAAERARGLEFLDDHLAVGIFKRLLNVGDSLTFIASTEENPNLDYNIELKNRNTYDRYLLSLWQSEQKNAKNLHPEWLEQLVLSADQFITLNRSLDGSSLLCINAGYPWFEEWSRDTMVSLTGLLLSTGRYELAKDILNGCSCFLSEGLFPDHHFDDESETPTYTNADTPLWYIHSVYDYIKMTGDKKILEVLLPTLEAIISCYIMGTKHNIHIDQNDGLLYVGEQGLAMTWMDATINENPVTPRTGKPVCLSALWYSALIIMSEFLKSVERPAQKYLSEAEKTKIGFDKFWNETTGYCYDVIEGTDGNDSSLRPNQIFAVSLPFSPLPLERQKKVVDICSKNLLTSFGLRTLAPNDQRYRGVYAGNLTERDLTYHNGTAWGWLLGPFVIAHFKVYHDSELALSYLEPMKQMLSAYGIGTLGELFDGDPPFTPRGCIAQAWTVAEVIRAYTYIINNIDTKAKKGTRNAA